MAKLKELTGADVNSPSGEIGEEERDERASGRLYRRPPEPSARRYMPIQTGTGDFVIVASQGRENEDEVMSLGHYHGVGPSHQWHRTRQAAQKDLYERLKRDGDDEPQKAYFARVSHVDPTDEVRRRASGQVLALPAGEVEETEASGRLYRRPPERSARRYTPIKTGTGDFVIIASQGRDNEDEVHGLGHYHGAGPSEWHMSRRAAQKDLYDRLKRDGDSEPQRAYFAKVSHVDPTDEVRRRASGAIHESSGRAGRRDAADVEALAESDALGAMPRLREMLAMYGPVRSTDRGVRVAMRAKISDMADRMIARRELRPSDRAVYKESFIAFAERRLASLSSASASVPVRRGEVAVEAFRSWLVSLPRRMQPKQWVPGMEARLRQAMSELEHAPGQADRLLRSLADDLERRFSARHLAAEVRGLAREHGVASGAVDSKVGWAVAGVGAAVLAGTAIAHAMSKGR